MRAMGSWSARLCLSSLFSSVRASGSGCSTLGGVVDDACERGDEYLIGGMMTPRDCTTFGVNGGVRTIGGGEIVDGGESRFDSERFSALSDVSISSSL